MNEGQPGYRWFFGILETALPAFYRDQMTGAMLKHLKTVRYDRGI